MPVNIVHVDMAVRRPTSNCTLVRNRFRDETLPPRSSSRDVNSPRDSLITPVLHPSPRRRFRAPSRPSARLSIRPSVRPREPLLNAPHYLEMFALALNHGPLIINPSPPLPSPPRCQSWPVVDSREYSATKYAMYVDEGKEKRDERSWTYAIKKARFPAAGLCRRLITALEEPCLQHDEVGEGEGEESSYKGPLT